MNKFGDCSDGTIPAEVPKQELMPDETVPVLFLSTALLGAVTQILSELGDDNELGMVLIVSDVDALSPGDGSIPRSEMVALDEMKLDLRLNVMNDEFPDLIFETLPYWQRVNDHPRGPGPKQRKGGKHLRAQKRQR